jgi:peptidoglycan/xylan/chitin deacetylase (PgdA/CDA1 family)
VGTVRAISAVQPQVVLTYDDGPDPQATPAVLAALAEHKATATFFVLTPRAQKHRSLLQEVIDAGHEIGLHGIDHTRLTKYPAAEVLRRCREGKAILEDLTGKPVRWFRAPYGALLLPHWTAVRRAGLEHVGWGPTAKDWVQLPEEEMAESALAEARAGEIILAHDSFAGLDVGVDDGPPPSVDRGKLAGLMLSGLASLGLQARSLGDTLDTAQASPARPRRWAWFIR